MKQDLKINIETEDIEKYITQKILDAKLGTMIKETLEKNLDEWLTGYRSPIKDYIREIVISVTKEKMNEPEQRKIVEDAIAKYMIPSTISNIVGTGLAKLKKDMEY